MRAAGSKTRSLAAHPGYAATNLQSASAPFVDRMVMKVTNLVLAQSAEKGTLPQLYAATHPGLESGEFIGPDGFKEQRGYPQHVTPHNREAYDEGIARRLWEVSEELTGVSYALPEPAAA